MGRFYKTAQPEFVTDGIYKPDWDLLGEALATKDKELENQANTIALLRDVPFNYRPEEEAYAKAARDKVAAGIDPIAKMFATDRLNPELGAKLAALKRDAMKEFKTGTIAQMELSKKNWDEFEKARLALKDNAAKEIYAKVPVMHDKMVRESGVYKPFVAPSMFNSRNLNEEFFASKTFDALKPSFIKWGKEGVLQERINAEYLAWLNNDPELKAYAANRDVYDYNPSEGKYLDDKGSFSFEKGYRLHNTALPATKAAEYIHTNYGAFSGGGSGGDKKDVYVPQAGISIVNPEKYRNMASLRNEYVLQSYLSPLVAEANKLGAGLDEKDFKGNYEKAISAIDLRLKEMKVDPDAPLTKGMTATARGLVAMKKALNEMYDKLTLHPTVSWDNFAKLLPNGVFEKLKANIDKGAIATHRMAVDFGSANINDVHGSDKLLLVSKPNDLIGSVVKVGGQYREITGVKVLTETTKPDGVSNRIELNYLQTGLEITYNDGTKEIVNGYTSAQDVYPVTDSGAKVDKDASPNPFAPGKVYDFDQKSEDDARKLHREELELAAPHHEKGNILSVVFGGREAANTAESLADKQSN